MTVYEQPYSTYDDTTAQMRLIADIVSMIDPTDTPLVDWLGLSSANKKFKFVGTPGQKVEWLEDAMEPLTTTLTADSGSSDTELDVTDATVFHVGDVLQDTTKTTGDYMWVSAIDDTTQKVTVTRGWGSTTAIALSNGDTVTRLFNTRVEGAESTRGNVVDIDAPYNYTQILHRELKLTADEIDQATYGIPRMWEYQASKRVPTLMRDLERTLYYGKRVQGSKTAARGTGGLPVFITDNLLSVAASSFGPDDISAMLKLCFDDGGAPKDLWTSSYVMNLLTGAYTSVLHIERDDSTLGTVYNAAITPFGDVKFHLSRHCPEKKVYYLDINHVGLYERRPFAWHELAVTGDYRRAEVLGEYALCLRHDKGHGIHTLT